MVAVGCSGAPKAVLGGPVVDHGLEFSVRRLDFGGKPQTCLVIRNAGDERLVVSDFGSVLFTCRGPGQGDVQRFDRHGELMDPRIEDKTRIIGLSEVASLAPGSELGFPVDADKVLAKRLPDSRATMTFECEYETDVYEHVRDHGVRLWTGPVEIELDGE